MSLLYDIAVTQWITLCHRNYLTTHVITLWCINIMSLTTLMSVLHLLIDIMSDSKVIKSHFKGYDEQNLILL